MRDRMDGWVLSVGEVTMRASLLVATVTVALLSAGGVSEAGFSAKRSNGSKITGTALTPAKKANVQAAINQIRASGRGRAADHAQKLLDTGKICQDATSGDCANADTSGSPTPTGGAINVSPGYLCGDLVVLGGELVHEETHLVMNSNPTDATQHCLAYWNHYKYLKQQKQNPPAGTSAAAIQAKMDGIAKWYPDFPTMPVSSQPTPPDPAKLSKKCKEVVYANGVPKSVSIITEGAGTVYNFTWDPTDTTTASLVETPIVTGFSALFGAAGMTTSQGKLVVVVSGTNAAETNGSVLALVDTDGDLVLDTVTTVVAFGGGLVKPRGVAAIRQPQGSVRWYVLDTVAGKIWSLLDTNGDQIPDALGSVYADTTLCPEIASAFDIFLWGELDEHGDPIAASYLGLQSMNSNLRKYRKDEWFLYLEDTDADGAADLTSGKLYMRDFETYEPDLWAGGCAGDQTMTIYGPQNHTVQTLRFNSQTGQYDTVVGSGQVGSNNLVTYGISPVLGVGQTFVLKDVNSGLVSTPFAVTQDVPRITEIVPHGGPRTGGTTVTITGTKLPLNPDVYFGEAAGTVVQSSATSITVVTPNLGSDAGGPMEITVLKNNQMARDWYFYFE